MIGPISFSPGNIGDLRYVFIGADGTPGTERSANISRVGSFNLFLINATPPNGALSVLLYDVTDTTNATDYSLQLATVTSRGALGSAFSAPYQTRSGRIRTSNYRDDVLFVAASELAIDVQSIDFTKDIARQWTSYANRHIKDAWEFWEWPELDITEERAFRNIWNSSKQFVRKTSSGKPDQLFHIPSLTYYDVLSTAPSDPPVGTLPTNATYFVPSDMTQFETYIDLDQPCQVSIGRVMGVYSANPSLNGSAPGIPYKPTEKGIFVRTTGPTAFIRYQILPSQFSSQEYDPALAYDKGALVYFNDDGNCYRSIVSVPTGQSPENTLYWALIPVPTRLAQYTALMVAASAAEDRQAKADLTAQAEASLTREIDKLTEQGQRLPRYKMGTGRRHHSNLAGWLCSLPWIASSGVTTLTDVCEDAGGVQTVEIKQSINQPFVNAQGYVDVVFGTALQLSWTLEDVHVEYSGTNTTIDVPGFVEANRATTGFRAVLDYTPGADAANYALVGKVRGIPL